MKRVLAFALFALPMAALGQSDQPLYPKQFSLPTNSAKRFVATCQAGRPMLALASGVGDVALGVYVYGPHGQCVAYDDEMLGKVDSDRVAVFVPGRSGAYEFEVRNLSDQTNRRVDADFRPTGGER
jgi:hypothetical protein